jgi:tRNA pseudouridine55 synthase
MMAQVDGILLLDKPSGISSNGALQKVRYMLNASKAGHSGTLDPMATGLLPIGLGQGTKALPYLLDAHKRYIATIKLGEVTTTGDAEGEVVAQARVPALSAALIESVLSLFRGHYSQTPPMYSALKQQGRPLYELAREGIVVERAPRDIHFYAIELLTWTEECLQLQVWCSKGTYIRVLAEDIGKTLSCGAHLIALRRIGVAGFDPISEGKKSHFSWCDWQSVLNQSLSSYLLPVDSALMHFDAISVTDEVLNRLSQGQKISVNDLDNPIQTNTPLRCYNNSGEFFALVKTTPFQGLMLERWMHS